MSQFHRHNPELVGTDADPWMQHDAYYKLPQSTRRCFDCGVGSGPCQCTPEFQAYETAMEELQAVPGESSVQDEAPPAPQEGK